MKWVGVLLPPLFLVYVGGGNFPWALFFAFFLLVGSHGLVFCCLLSTLAVVGIVPFLSSGSSGAIGYVITPSPTVIPHIILALSFWFALGNRLLDTTFLSWLARRRLSGLVAAPRKLLPYFALGCFVCALFRRYPADLLVSAGLLSLVFCWRWPRAARQDTWIVWRSRFANMAVLLTSTLISLALLEVVVRCLFTSPGSHQNVYMGIYDPQYIFSLCPGIQAERRISAGPGQYTPVTYSISSQGLRDREYGPKQPGEYRILMLGDSFTMGDAVNEEDTIPRCLERELRLRAPQATISVINAGMGGAGPIQELGMLRKRGFGLEPDLVILQIFTGNDIDNSLELTGKRLRAYEPAWYNTLNRLQLHDTVPYEVDDWFYTHFQTYREIVARANDMPLIDNLIAAARFFPPNLLKKSSPSDDDRLRREADLNSWYPGVATAPRTPFIANLIAATRFFPPSLLKDYPPSEDRRFWLEPDLRTWYPELEEGLQLLASYITEMRDECVARGIPFVAYCIPVSDQVREKDWIAETKDVVGQAEYERFKGIAKVEEALDRAKIPHFSVLDALLNHPKIDELFYYFYDGHCTPLGNRVVAGRIADYLGSKPFSGH